MLIEFAKTIATRATLALSAITGKLDHVPSLGVEIERLQSVEKRLRQALEVENYNKDYWCKLWFAAGSSHSNAQAAMSDEIEKRGEVARKLMFILKDFSKSKKPVVFPKEFESIVATFEMGPWLEMVEKYRGAFVNTKHPEDIDQSCVPGAKP